MMISSRKCWVASGLDTTFLVQVEVLEHAGHAEARALLDSLLRHGETLALAPQVLAEFVHVVTDSRRFSCPLEVSVALERAEHWWQSGEVMQVLPSLDSTALFLSWMTQHRLGRKRILDTQLAATYHCAGIKRLLTTNARDYKIFDCFEVVGPEP